MKTVFAVLLFSAAAQAAVDSAAVQNEQLQQGLNLVQAKKYQQAETYFKQLNSRYPQQITYLNNLAAVQMAQGKTELALKNLQQATVADKTFSVMQKNISDIYAYMASLAYAKALEKKQSTALPELALISELKTKPEPVAEVKEETQAAEIASKTEQQLMTEIKEKTSSWSKAWMAGNFKDYLSAYSENFVPSGGLSYDKWRAQRRYRLRHSKQVEVSYNQLNIFFNAEKTLAITEFVQQYKAGQYNDKVKKQLYWQSENGSWLIAREQVIEKL